MTDLTLSQWLSNLYQADLRAKLPPAIVDFKTAMANSPELLAQAKAEMKQLDEMIAARGRGACAFSTRYNDYLQEALDASS